MESSINFDSFKYNSNKSNSKSSRSRSKSKSKSNSKSRRNSNAHDTISKLTNLRKDATHRKIQFETDYNLILKMRENQTAPVDTMGASFTCDQNTKETDWQLYKYQCWVSLLLSSQTRDACTFQATKNWIEHGLNISNILKTPTDKIIELIYPVSFHNVKAETIKKLTNIIRDQYGDDPPETLREVVKLPGIGNKMGWLYLKDCLGKLEGIPVDSHVHVISTRLGWVSERKSVEFTRKELEEIVDRKYWKDFNAIIVGFGQEICQTGNPKCGMCFLKDTCGYYAQLKEINELKLNMKKEEKINKKKKRRQEKINNARYLCQMLKYYL